MNRCFAAAAALAALIPACASTSPCRAAGTINLSLSQQFDTQGRPLGGCKLYFFQAGTTTPQNAFQDTGLTIPWPNPMECDASGRIAQFFLADGSIKIRLADKFGNTILAADNLLVIGPSSGGGGGGGVDATTVLATGDIKVKYGTGPISGFVRANGRTIGNAVSGATERANADTQALFEYLWNTDASLTVSGGRGATSTADYNAGKQLTLPDARGRTIAALDDMVNTSAARLNLLASTTLGAAGGAQSASLAGANLPVIDYTPAGAVTVTLTDPGHSHGVSDPGHSHGITDPGHAHSYNLYNSIVVGGTGNSAQATSAGGGQNTAAALTGISINGATTGVSVNGAATGITVNQHSFAGTLAHLGGAATAFSVTPPVILMSVYLKL